MKSKKSLIALVGLLAVTLVGGSLAYFSQNISKENTFKTGKYDTEITETFTPPTNWVPGVDVPKSVAVTNTGNVQVVVRANFNEAWTKAGAELDGTFMAENVKKEAAIKQLGNVISYEEFAADQAAAAGKWVAVNGNYYYIGVVAKDGSTSELLKSVSLNPLLTAGVTEKTSVGGSQTVTTSGTGANYDDAQYKLTVNATTVQATKAAVLDTFTTSDTSEKAVIDYIITLCGTDLEAK